MVNVVGQVPGQDCVLGMPGHGHQDDEAHGQLELGAQEGCHAGQGEPGGEAGQGAEVGAEQEIKTVGHQDQGHEVGRNKEAGV